MAQIESDGRNNQLNERANWELARLNPTTYNEIKKMSILQYYNYIREVERQNKPKK
jgi:hypothetical protein